jgi:hypothetical protein
MSTQQSADGEREWDEWEILEERLGQPGCPHAEERAAQLTTEGWQLVAVLFGVWRFRRRKHDSDWPRAS